MMKNPRALAAQIISELLQRQASLTDLLNGKLMQQSQVKDKAFIQECCYGVARWYYRLIFISKLLLEKPLKDKDHDIYCLLLIGLYQLLFLRVPAHAAISETVNATIDLKKSWAKGLVNAVLRNMQRKQSEIMAQVQVNPIANYAHPPWLMTQLQTAWPKQWETISNANNQYPPLTLRVNRLKVSREVYLKKLAEQNIQVLPCAENACGIILEKPVDVKQLPGFSEGWVSVQDLAAQMAAGLLELQPNQRVLDACAAPGGKTTHILETEPGLAELLALDNDAKRLQRVQENLQRLGLTARLQHADVVDVSQWWDSKSFDRILLDAPCSATGVIRRHPDIKILRKKTDIKTLAKQQLTMLETLWPLLASKGILLYATCSILPEENSEVIQTFLANHADAKEIPISADWGIATKVGRQILPGMQNMDGFYYAKLMKI